GSGPTRRAGGPATTTRVITHIIRTPDAIPPLRFPGTAAIVEPYCAPGAEAEADPWLLLDRGATPMNDFQIEAAHWARTQFAGAKLGDRRRTARLVTLATQVACNPSASLPDQTESWADLKAAYR